MHAVQIGESNIRVTHLSSSIQPTISGVDTIPDTSHILQQMEFLGEEQGGQWDRK